jgi:hypothetical protein
VDTSKLELGSHLKIQETLWRYVEEKGVDDCDARWLRVAVRAVRGLGIT